MKCRYCGSIDSRVVDSRPSDDGLSIRRRRECNACGHRFTTFERIEENPIMVVKRDGRREPFDREKVAAGIRKACEKRPISADEQNQLLDEIARAAGIVDGTHGTTGEEIAILEFLLLAIQGVCAEYIVETIEHDIVI